MFYLATTRVLLTYSALLPADACDDCISDLQATFDQYTFDSDHSLTAMEEHDDGTYHIHKYLLYYNTCYVDDARYFDIDGYHPNVEAVGNTRKDHGQVLRYLRKAGYFWGDLRECHHMTRDDVYSRARFMKSADKARGLIASHASRDWFISHSNVEKTLSFLFPQPPPPLYVSPYVFTDVPRPLTDWVAHLGQQGRKYALVLFGASRTHKTSWARSIGPHVYYKGRIDITREDDRATYRVFDDIHPRDFPNFDYKSWFGPDEFTATGKYLPNSSIRPLPAIYICNRLPTVRSHMDFDWWISNTIRYNVIDTIL